MCLDEFNKLFCKGLFKEALINTLDSLQSDGAAGKEKKQTPEAQGAQEAAEGMPLGLKIEHYQRNKVLTGLDHLAPLH